MRATHCFHSECVATKYSVDLTKDSNAVSDKCSSCFMESTVTNLLEKIEGRLAGLESMKKSLESMTETVATLVNDNKEIREDLKECQNKIGSVGNDVKEVTSKIENVSRKVNDHNTRLAAVESKITGAAGANAVLADYDTSLRVACLSLANQTDPNKLDKDFVPALANCLDVALSEFEIIRAQCMGRKKINAQSVTGRIRSRAIVVELTSASKFSVNRRTPVELRELCDKVRKRFTQIDAKFIWIMDDAVLIRKDASSKPIRIVPSTNLEGIDL
ncbi:hypothetical protein KQX54_015872 [Cotesia glomerata]|uniref:FP protein C-terminal domain-containing protein n=1 Tax=Cotesia glomerata TaxID=32391 RepID=A0AAV7IMY4_COTGL|nr:hypothetical protein KQX54_015872 [Cotesia glomerata]